MIRVFQYKLYPNRSQIKTLERWLGICCWVYNNALAQRIKAYRRRGESINYNAQQALLTKQRARIDFLRAVPLTFSRDALRRVDSGMTAFFRRVKAGDKPGFPRFRSGHRYNSLECLDIQKYLRGNRIRVPKIGAIRCRGRLLPDGKQLGLRVKRRASCWYAQIILDDGRDTPIQKAIDSVIGIDVGLTHFATLSDGEQINNPRWFSKSARKLRALQRRVSRRVKGSVNRRRAVRALRRQHERVADQRRNFCHQHSTALVRKYDLIAVEKLNVKGMIRSRFGKSISDAAWSTFTTQLVVKAVCAGQQVVFVDARRTSQECPNCGAIVPKKLSERIHKCGCGLECHRDHASARVILARALVATGVTRPSMESTSDAALVVQHQVDQVKREDSICSG